MLHYRGNKVNRSRPGQPTDKRLQPFFTKTFAMSVAQIIKSVRKDNQSVPWIQRDRDLLVFGQTRYPDGHAAPSQKSNLSIRCDMQRVGVPSLHDPARAGLRVEDHEDRRKKWQSPPTSCG